MSVTFITARINDVFQYNNFPEMTLEEAESLDAHWYYTSSGLWVKTNYKFVQILTCGWSGGAFLRTKNLPLNKALLYVNKLHIGKWISDDTYNTMYTVVDFLLQDHTPFRGDDFNRLARGDTNQYATVVDTESGFLSESAQEAPPKVDPLDIQWELTFQSVNDKCS